MSNEEKGRFAVTNASDIESDEEWQKLDPHVKDHSPERCKMHFNYDIINVILF